LGNIKSWKYEYSKSYFRRSRNSNSCFSFWWYTADPPFTSTEEYDGTSWTTSPGSSLSTARDSLGGAGTQTAALAFGGATTVGTAATEEWTGAGTNNSYNHSFLTLYLFI
jgi:hypothetical protein